MVGKDGCANSGPYLFLCENTSAPEQRLVPLEVIERCIFLIRGHKVTLDSDLAELYQVETKGLNQAVKRNQNRFPEGFMFRLRPLEAKGLRFRFGTSNEAESLKSQIVTTKRGRGADTRLTPSRNRASQCFRAL
jgi:hypothetical protein